MAVRLTFFFLVAALVLCGWRASAQIDSVIGQLSNSNFEAFAGSISGDGRFVVFESRGNLATEDPRNADGNNEIFLFDYAQRRIFQITNTKSVLFNVNGGTGFSNVRVEISNTRPSISNDGKWIAFSSNATTSRPMTPDSTNPGLFDGNAYTSSTPTPSPSPAGSPSPTASPSPGTNPLTEDGNLEMWLYQIPAYAPVADLSDGDELPVTNLAPYDASGNPTAGAQFIRVTNTDPSQLPRPGSAQSSPTIADDNHDASISDDGNVIAFASTRDLVPAVGNAYPDEDNDEIFTYVRSAATLGQVTKTPRGPIGNPIYSKYPSISADGTRVAFASTAENPIVGMTGGMNPLSSRNEEIYYADLVAGSPTAGTMKKQVTTTTPTNPGDPVNIYDQGRRMSRDGRYIAFDSYADLANENSGTNYTSFATYLYDSTDNSFRRILARSTADPAAPGGDVQRYPGFTDYDATGKPLTLVLETRMNIKADGTIPSNPDEGLNNNVVRPAQIYSFPLNVPAANAVFTRLAKFPPSVALIASTQLLPSNTQQRMAFNLALTELGSGNFDLASEVFYFLRPTVANQAPFSGQFITGASGRPVSMTPVPTPPPATPSPQPTPTPSPSPTASPTGTPTATPTPPQVTPPAVFGLAPGMSAILNYQAGFDRSIVARTAVGSLMRSFTLPIELSGVSMTINGAACGLKSVSRHKIEFVVPQGLIPEATGTTYPLVINARGTVLKMNVTVVPAQPDIFNHEGIIGPGGRAKVFNATNTVLTTEPFAVRTIKRKGNRLVATVLRVYFTGAGNLALQPGGAQQLISVRIGNVNMATTLIRSAATLVEPGVYYVDFELPPELARSGDQPIVVTFTIGTQQFQSRLDDTSARLFIL